MSRMAHRECQSCKHYLVRRWSTCYCTAHSKKTKKPITRRLKRFTNNLCTDFEHKGDNDD